MHIIIIIIIIRHPVLVRRPRRGRDEASVVGLAVVT